MPAAHERLAALRQLVEEKFPSAPSIAPGDRFVTGCPSLDQQGGLRRGALTEICSSAAAGQLALAALLEAAERDGSLMALIDPANALEPADWSQAQLHRLLWVRGGTVELALKAADFLLRDGNLPLLVLDLQVVPEAQLRRIPVSTWHRFHRVIESSSTILILLTPRPMVEGVTSRIALKTNATLASLSQSRTTLTRQLAAQTYERGQPSDFLVLEKSA